MKQRNSAFELVKIIAIICIIFCHSIPAEQIEYHYATNDPWLFGIILFRQLGSIGNAIFIVSSAWFLVDNDNVHLSKIKKILLDNQVISVFFLLIFLICANSNITFKLAVKQIFPFLFMNLWYVTCYVLYYSVHGLLNQGLNTSMPKDKIVLFILLAYDIYAFVIGGLYFSEFIAFLCIHAFTRSLKRMLSKLDSSKMQIYGLAILLTGIMGWLLGAVLINIVGIHISFIGNNLYRWNSFCNPFILAIAYGALMLASCRNYHSEILNRLSGISLYIYMITGNQLLRMFFDNDLYIFWGQKYGTTSKFCFVFVILYALVKTICGIVLSFLYQYTVGKATTKLTLK